MVGLFKIPAGQTTRARSMSNVVVRALRVPALIIHEVGKAEKIVTFAITWSRCTKTTYVDTRTKQVFVS